MAVYRYGKKTSDINVQSDFNIKDTKSDAFIKNRPDSTLSIALDGVEQKKHYNPNTGSETINIDLSDTIIAQDNKLNNAIASLEVSRIGGSGKYISDISEKDGKISATAVSTASTFSSTSTTAINGVGVNEALKTLNVAEVGSNGKYIQKIKEDNGKISATLKSFDTIISDESTDDNVPTSKAVNTKIFSEINKLNVNEVGEEGKYIEKILENSGKISTVVKTMDTAPTANSKKPVTSGGVKSYVDIQVNTEKTNRETAIAALDSTSTLTAGNYYTGMTETNGIVTLSQSAMDTIPTANSKKPVTSGGVKSYVDSLNKSLVGEDGSYIKTISESKGIITATKQTFDTTISSDSTDNNTPTSKAVKDYVDSEISNLNTDLTTAINGKQASGNYKTTQTAVSSPAASGNATAFIDTISQNANGVITVTKKNVPSATQSVAGLMSAADKTKLDGLATHTTLSKTSTLSGMTKDEVYYINTTGITTTVSAITNMGIKLTFVTNVATTIKYYNTSGTLTTKSMDAGTVFFLFSCGSGYTPNLYGTVLDINPSSTSVGQIYIKTK